ncbi:plasmid mobilization protein [Psychrobacter aquimaris]|jgi:16S rRNA C1402 N4-methylase RsmH|uniref:plasmid mobilization protein n=1 Tax=Psychrobacter aquimaris TaxID=292733 RepID=UPI001865BD70|nr:plasmid mobilization relaxosome protein MobC [Psychrobacter aquimaris]
MTDDKKSIRNLKDKKVQIRMSADEKALILERAQGADISTFLRDLGLGHDPKVPKQKPKVIVHSADPELIRYIAKIGNNINQIAKNLNLTKELDQQAFSQIQMIRLDLNNELERLRNVK